MRNSIAIVGDSFLQADAPPEPVFTPPRRSRVQSVSVGAELLRVLAAAEGPLALGALARAAAMPAPKAHRYLAGFLDAGLVRQHSQSGTYDLGPLAVALGLAALRRSQAATIAAERLGELRDAIGQTTLLAVWTLDGPAVTRIELSRHPVTLAVRVGTAFPLLTSATGGVFLAYGDPSDTRPAIERERATPAGAAIDVEALAQRIRAVGLAHVDQTFLVGVEALSVPIFSPGGVLAAAVTAIGRAGTVEFGPTDAIAGLMQTFARALL